MGPPLRNLRVQGLGKHTVVGSSGSRNGGITRQGYYRGRSIDDAIMRRLIQVQNPACRALPSPSVRVYKETAQNRGSESHRRVLQLTDRGAS